MQDADENIWVLLSIGGIRYTTHVTFSAGSMSEKDACALAVWRAWLEIAAPKCIAYDRVQVVGIHRRQTVCGA